MPMPQSLKWFQNDKIPLYFFSILFFSSIFLLLFSLPFEQVKPPGTVCYLRPPPKKKSTNKRTNKQTNKQTNETVFLCQLDYRYDFTCSRVWLAAEFSLNLATWETCIRQIVILEEKNIRKSLAGPGLYPPNMKRNKREKQEVGVNS